MINYRWYLSLVLSSVLVATTLGLYISYPNEAGMPKVAHAALSAAGWFLGMLVFYGMLSGLVYIVAGYIFKFLEGGKEDKVAKSEVCCEKKD